MPKKRCCCNVEPEPEDFGDCCRPIGSHCVGKSYRFTYKFKAKYPCVKFNSPFADIQYRCPNGSFVNVLGEPEEWVLNIEYTINKEAKVRGRYGRFISGNFRFNFVDETGSPCTPTFPASNNAAVGPYADCTDVNLTKCYPFGINNTSIAWPPLFNTGLRLNGCYDSYSIKNPYETCQTNGITNLVNVSSYSFQFIPSTIQQQTNYQPKLTPNLLLFELACQKFDISFDINEAPGYDINFAIGLGLNTVANCGSGNNIPIVIPYSETIDDFFGETVYIGVRFDGFFRRQIITTDNMNICFPKTTKLFQYTPSPSSIFCGRNPNGNNIFYKDSYTTVNSFYRFWQESGIYQFPVLPCENTYVDPSVWPNACEYFGFNNVIDVVEI